MAVAVESKELFEQPEPEKKVTGHVRVALNHLNKQRTKLLAEKEALEKELAQLDSSILALG